MLFIQTEDTPNPSTMKFSPGREVMPAGQSASFSNAKEAEASPLAALLFEIEGVSHILLTADFVAVTKAKRAEWTKLRPLVLGTLMDAFLTHTPAMLIPESAAPKHHKSTANDSEIVDQILEILDFKVRPMLARDGGDAVFQGFEDGIVTLRLKGACAGCPSATMTLKNGVERLLRETIPEVREVRQAKP